MNRNFWFCVGGSFERGLVSRDVIVFLRENAGGEETSFGKRLHINQPAEEMRLNAPDFLLTF
jgi:hypothetical protein